MCEFVNDIEASVCSRCGSPFGKLLATPPRRASRAKRERAIPLSVALPGLGHWAMGRDGEALARTILYVWSVGIALLLLLRPSATGGAVVRAVGALFALAAAGVWLLSLLETMRLVQGDGRSLVPPKALTWVALALSVILVMGLLGSALAGRSA